MLLQLSGCWLLQRRSAMVSNPPPPPNNYQSATDNQLVNVEVLVLMHGYGYVYKPFIAVPHNMLIDQQLNLHGSHLLCLRHAIYNIILKPTPHHVLIKSIISSV